MELFDYGYLGELGLFFIPKAMQNASKIKAYHKETVTLVECKLEKSSIILTHHKTISREEHKETQKENPKEIRTLDEFGRVALPKNHMEKLQISPGDILISRLLNDTTIEIKRSRQ